MARIYNDEFRREAVRIVLTSGLSRRQVASDLEVGFSTLAKWVQTSKSEDLPPAADIDLAKENERLRRESRLLLEEREILKKPRCSSRSKASEICFCALSFGKITANRYQLVGCARPWASPRVAIEPGADDR